MGRKRRFSKLLLFAAMVSTIGAGVLGSVPLPVKAAEEEEAYTVTFKAYEGTCDTESVTVPKGESIILPDGYYEGHFLESWMDITDSVTEEGIVTRFTAVGRPGSSYTPERDLWLHANWKPVEEQDINVTYEARIGDANYEELEEAFANAQAGDTITVLKDCSVSKTLEAAADNITLQSEDVGNPVTISRDEEFTGKNFDRIDVDNVLLGIEGSLTMRDIILDGGAELDGDFNNAGQTWDSPLVYVTGAFTMEEGTILQNNYNTDHDEENRSFRSAGAIHVAWGGEFTMTGGLIHHCYTNGAGGGIQTGRTSPVTITSGTIRDCYAMVGAAMDFFGPTNVSGMTIHNNKARAAIVAVHGEVTLSDCLIENNKVTGDAGTVSVSENYPVVIEGCTITGNHNRYTSAIGYSGKERTEPLTIRDCTIRGNTAEDPYSSTTINYLTKADLILDGKIVMEENTVADGKALDIRFYYEDATPVTLGADFESDSVFVMLGRNAAPGAFLVDAASNGKEADVSQFVWKSLNYKTEEKEGNIYLAENPMTYVISYDANNSSPGSGSIYTDPNRYTSKDAAVIMDQEALFPFMGNIVKFGYDFTGWNTKADGTGTDYAPGQEINLTKNLYLYAKWEAKEPVTLTYIYNDGEGRTDSAQVIPGANIAFPDASRKGYNFKGWYEDEALTVFAGNAGEKHYAPQQDASYYAAWEKTDAAVTFDADGGKMEGGDVTAKIGDTITLPNCTKEGYEFTGWYDGDTCIGQAGEEYTVSDDVTLKAHYEKKETAICTITFDADGGKMEGGTIIAKAGDTVTLPNCTKDGYEFTGWYDGNTCIGKVGEKYTVSADATLKARYEKKEEQAVICTVTFDADGGDTVRKSIDVEKGSAILLPSCSKTGYEFLGWFLASDDNICIGQAGEEFTVQGDISLKAHFEKKEAVKVTITFDTDGGKSVNPIKAAKGAIIYLPKTEKDGYSFLGWYTEKDGGILLGIPGSEMKAVKDMTAYALWEKETDKDTDNDADPEACKVTFHAGKGTIKVKELTIIKDGSLYLPMPEREGYDFTGWYLDDNLTQFAGAYHDTYRITRDTDFYAKWEKSKGNSGNTGDENGTGNDNTEDGDNSGENLNTYTIKYDANGGKTKNASVKVAKGGSVKLPGAEREGYTFKGWYTDRQVFIGTEGETYKPSRSISLYARWEKAENDGKNDSDNSGTENTSDKDNKNTSDKNQNTSGTVSGNSAGSPSDKDTDTRTEGGNGNAGKGTEPVIQTGHASPFYLLATLGLCGVVLAAASVLEGKKEGKCSL
ncbi:MAG: InlB B-repeat-containing protein [Lachnospiraceae bacterium]|nr:InlB B-repeat-containing protein [Lachnospiraceae bacterium]